MKKRFCRLLCVCLISLLLCACGSTTPATDQVPETQPTLTEPKETMPPATEEPTFPPEPWDGNVLKGETNQMPGGALLGTDLQKNDFTIITFLDTVANAPEDSYNVTEGTEGVVLAWEGNKGELIIAAEGGINAKNCAHLFSGYEKLKKINFNDCFHTDRAKSMNNMFSYCYELTSLDLSSFNTAQVTKMYYMFNDCQSLKELDLSSFDTSRVKAMDRMFEGCSNLTKLDLSSFDTAQVIYMNSMFDGCNNLVELDLSSFDTAQVTDMAFMFSDCTRLTALDLSSFDTARVTDMTYMFSYCQNLTALDLSSFDTARTTSMAGMFSNCEKLPRLELSSFDTAQVTDMAYMFYRCMNLKELDVSNFNTSKVTDFACLMTYCPESMSITTGNGFSLRCNAEDFDGIDTVNGLPVIQWLASVTSDPYTRMTLLRPENGEVFHKSIGESDCVFTVSAGSQDACIKLENIQDPSKYILFYVQADSHVTIHPAAGQYIVKYTSGEYWYSQDEYFGPDSSFARADEILEFEETSSTYSVISITLYTVAGGNMVVDPISSDDF